MSRRMIDTLEDTKKIVSQLLPDQELRMDVLEMSCEDVKEALVFPSPTI